MGMPYSLPEGKRPTKATLYFSVDEIKALHIRFRQLVPKDYVIFEDSFAAYCLWSQICKQETSRVLFRAFDVLKRGFFDFEDFAQTAGALARGNPEQVSEVLFRMLLCINNGRSSSIAHDTANGVEGETVVQQQQQQQQRHPSGTAVDPAMVVVRYQDVVCTLKALDTSFLVLRCDGGTTAQSVAARMPFDEYGALSLEELRKKVEQRL